ncbi:MAG: HD-GYP domain-containing protein [Bacteroidales bacterium]
MSDPAGKVLVVDDLAANAEVLERALKARGYVVSIAHDGPTALRLVAEESPDIVLLDIMMPGMNGFEVCRQIKSSPATRLTPVVLVTGLGDREDRIRGIEAGADDFLTKPPVLAELTARVRSLVRLKRYTDELESAESMVVSLALTIEARDAYTEGHCERLARYATALGRELGLPDRDLAALYRGGYLHDLGKVGVPDVVLLKQGPLSPDEIILMRSHPIVGDRLCGGLRSLRPVRPIIRHHHERLDGSGYPDGLAGDEIPLLAQIISIVDIFDALTTSRPYRRALEHEDASRELFDEARQRWLNADLVAAFTAMVRERRLPSSDEDGALRARYAHPRWDMGNGG